MAGIAARQIAAGARWVMGRYAGWVALSEHPTWVMGADGTVQAVLVKEYPDLAAYQQDAPVMALNGYQVIATSESPQNAGLARILTLGLISLVVRPRAHYIVTYKRIADAV